MSKVIFSGLEGDGKSLQLAKQAKKLVLRNAKWKEVSKTEACPEGVTRPIYSNMKFSENFTAFAESKGIPLKYWSNLDDLIKIEQADVIIDEVGNYFDSRLWADLTLDARRWLTQGSKMGIELYGSAQDFAQVDKAFRRLVNELIHISKICGSPRPSATRPPVTRIWGICSMRPLDPQTYDESVDKFAAASLFSMRWFRIRRQDCEIFDTTQKIQRSLPSPYRHIQRYCELHGLPDGCSFSKIEHR